jgi:hypothetical protein
MPFTLGLWIAVNQPRMPLAKCVTSTAGPIRSSRWSANHNCGFWTGGTLDPITGNAGGILHFQP